MQQSLFVGHLRADVVVHTSRIVLKSLYIRVPKIVPLLELFGSKGGTFRFQGRNFSVPVEELSSSKGGTNKFFGTSISFFRSFISFFRTFISAFRREFSFARWRFPISSGEIAISGDAAVATKRVYSTVELGSSHIIRAERVIMRWSWSFWSAQYCANDVFRTFAPTNKDTTPHTNAGNTKYRYHRSRRPR